MYAGKAVHCMDVGKRLFVDRDYRNVILAGKGFYRWMPDEHYLKLLFRAKMKRPLSLENPRTFNEKLQWLKLYDRRMEYTVMADKYRVREYIAKKIGGNYLVPLLGVWEDPDDIDFSKLPNQFVLKCNHNSGYGMCICREKEQLDYSRVRKQLKEGQKEDYYQKYREWPYKNIERKVIAEKYLMDRDQPDGIVDYKVHNFNGVPKVILVCKNRFRTGGMTEDFFDSTWKHLQLSRKNYQNAEECPAKPQKLGQMLELACALSENVPFLRTDFYEVEGKLYFGELTFFPAAGMEAFVPQEWDEIMGEWLVLPSRQIGRKL